MRRKKQTKSESCPGATREFPARSPDLDLRAALGAPYTGRLVSLRSYRIEYEIDGRERHEDVELFTAHYRGAHAASHGKTGFRIYAVGSIPARIP